MKKRKSPASWLFALVLALGFLVMQNTTGLPQAAAADAAEKIAAPGQAVTNSDKSQEGEQQTAVSLEQAIKIAREAFKIPADFDKFTNGFDQSKQGAFWELHWNRSAKSGGYIDIRVNAQNGEIWSMSQWSPPLDGSSYQGLPTYSREQTKDIATALAEKLHPARFRETLLQPGRDYFPPLLSQPRGQVEYRYNFARVVNGFSYLENSINVTVNGDTGEVSGFNLNWDANASFPDPSGSISMEQAEQVFRTQATPQLYYFRPRIPGGSEVPIKLVYGLPGQKTQVLIDALTGNILDNNGNYYGLYGMSGGGDMNMADSKMKEYQLNPVEISAVEDAKNLLPQDTALAKARSAVSVPGEYSLRSSRLEQDYLFTDKKTWHFNWEAGEEPERKWLDISVDASSGELVSFYLNEYNMLDKLKATEPKFSEADARKAAESFINKVQAEKWEQVVFKDAQPVMGPFMSEKQLPSAYTFVWFRVARDGIQFPDNGFNVDVDAVTGEITGFQMNWYNVDLPEPQGVMEPDAAAGVFLQEAPLAEAYLSLWPEEQWKGSTEEAKIHLVYHLTNQYFTMLNAFSGQPLNSDGEVAVATPEEVGFEDLDGNPYGEAVEMLSSAGIINAVGGEFRPNDVVTQAELIAMLVRAGTYSQWGVRPLSAGSEEAWYQPYYEQAVQLGILQKGEQPDPDAPVTRIFMARLSIHAMDLYRVAKLSDIYVLNFQDAAEIPEYLRGHAALSVGMGLLEPQEGNFRPQTFVSRGEAATTLVKLLNSWK
ncbi:MAG: S-layer homology domain-containing protein [Desulfotomaculaceae bacterium]|nr:S-layer homology domain-containing protein [Desulfotomaculaceae bacterium]